MTLFKINRVLGTHLPNVLLKPQLSPAHKCIWCSSGVQDEHLHHTYIIQEWQGDLSKVISCCSEEQRPGALLPK